MKRDLEKGIRVGKLATAAGLLALLPFVAAPALAQQPCEAGWSSIGEPDLPSDDIPIINRVRVLDAGDGPALYAVGEFTSIGGVPATNVAKWDGAHWTAFEGGAAVPPQVFDIEVYDDGAGPALYIGGQDYTLADGRKPLLLKWTADGWTPVGEQTTTLVPGYPTAPALRLRTIDTFDGPKLLVGGFVDAVNGVQVDGAALWDGEVWSAFGLGVRYTTYAPFGMIDTIQPYQGGVYVGGQFNSVCCGSGATNNVAFWNGGGLNATPGLTTSAVLPTVRDFAIFDDGDGAHLYGAGAFSAGGGFARMDAGAWSGAGPSALGLHLLGPVPMGDSLAFHDDGETDALYVGATFPPAPNTDAGGRVARIARWDGVALTALPGDLVSNAGDAVAASLASYDDRDGSALYVGGRFNTLDGRPFQSLARWGCIKGDLNCDGRLDFFDIDAFLLALFDRTVFQQQHPGCQPLLGDMNHDGSLDFLDIGGFVAKLIPS